VGEEPDILVGPQLGGTARSLLLCRHCAGTFVRGPVGSPKRVETAMWNMYACQMASDVAAAGMVFRTAFARRRR